MARFDPATKDDIYSTTETAQAVGVHPVTLRRWLATGDGRPMGELQQWLADNNRSELSFIELSNGKRVWQFGNQNRTDLREFKRVKDEGVRKENKPREARIARPRPLNAHERRLRLLIRQYAKALVALEGQGFAPQDSRLAEITRRRVPLTEMVSMVTRNNHGQWWR